MQCGHFVGGRKNAVLFNEECVRAQCSGCNVFLRGNYQIFTLRMLNEVGLEKVEEILSLKHQTKKYTVSEIEELIESLEKRLSTPVLKELEAA